MHRVKRGLWTTCQSDLDLCSPPDDVSRTTRQDSLLVYDPAFSATALEVRSPEVGKPGGGRSTPSLSGADAAALKSSGRPVAREPSGSPCAATSKMMMFRAGSVAVGRFFRSRARKRVSWAAIARPRKPTGSRWLGRPVHFRFTGRSRMTLARGGA